MNDDYESWPRVGDYMRLIVRKDRSTGLWGFCIQAENGSRRIGVGFKSERDAYRKGVAALGELRG